MFTHHFKYIFKTLLKNKALIFWTFAFPLILASFFSMAFSNIAESEKMKAVSIAVIDNEEWQKNEVFQNAFHTLSDKNQKERLFETTYTTEENAKELLEQEKIIGYLKFENGNTKIIVTTNGVEETILKYAVEEISITENIIQNLSKEEIEKEFASGNVLPNYEKIIQNIYEKLEGSEIELKNSTSNHMDYSMIEFYTLIAMTCMYGGILGMYAINQSLANMSEKGKRVAVSPARKGAIIISSLLASYIIQIIGLALLFVYTVGILNVNYGQSIWAIILLAFVGSFAGLSLGTFIGAVIKSKEDMKTGILIASTMFGCFLAGMFGISMKYIVDKNVPLLGKINPVSMITDGFYSLYYYDTLERYWFNIISLLIFSTLLIAISLTSLRRQKYDSI